MDILDFIAIFVLIVGTERWARWTMISIGLVFLMFGHWIIAAIFFSVAYAAYQLTKG